MSRTPSSRRDFLRHAAALGMTGAVAGCATTQTAQAPPPAAPVAPVAAAAPVEAPKAIPERRTPAPGEKIRIGWIGAGSRGGGVLQEALPFDDIDVVAVCDSYDPWRDRAVAWCKKARPNTPVTPYVRFEEMLEKETLHAVHIATPDHIHFPAIMAALDLGLDVYSEKPMTLTWDEAEAVQARVDETGAVLQVGTQLRSLSMYRQVRERLAAGEIGQLVEVHVNRHSAGGSLTRRNPPGEVTAANTHWEVFLRDTKQYAFDPRRYFLWRLYEEYSNGVIGDLMVHHLDICHFVTGAAMPTCVMSVGDNAVFKDGRTVPDTVSVLLKYGEGFHFNYTTTLANNHYGLVERYIGTEGVIDIEGMGSFTVHRRGSADTVKSPALDTKAHLADFYRCIRSRGTTIAPAAAGFQASAVASMAMLSQRTERAVLWNAGERRVYA